MLRDRASQGAIAMAPGAWYRGGQHHATWGHPVKVGLILRQIPLIGAIALLYWLIALFIPDTLGRTVLSLTLPSGAAWTLSTGELLLLLGLVALYLEILKSTHTTHMLDHVLSLAAFVISLIGFLLASRLGSSTFLLLLVMQLIDVIAGFSVSMTAARRDITYVDERST